MAQRDTQVLPYRHQTENHAESQLAALKRRRPAVLVGLLLVLMLLVMFALSTGEVSVRFDQVIGILLNKIGIPLKVTYETRQEAIINVIRLPRVIMAVLLGGMLAYAGAILQGLFRSPLADPGLIGVSSGAALATAIMLAVSGRLFASLGDTEVKILISIAACFGAAGTSYLLYRLSTVAGHTSIATMLLIGIALNALASAIIGIIVTSSNTDTLRNIEFWAFGSLARATWDQIHVMLPFVAVTLFSMRYLIHPLNIFLLGGTEAEHLGINVRLLKWMVIGTSALAVGAGVAFAGIIGFVALVAPHVLRLMIGPDHRFILPGSWLLGAIILVGADLASRTIAAPAEVPIGVVTALLGAPFFMWLLFQDRRRGGGL